MWEQNRWPKCVLKVLLLDYWRKMPRCPYKWISHSKVEYLGTQISLLALTNIEDLERVKTRYGVRSYPYMNICCIYLLWTMEPIQTKPWRKLGWWHLGWWDLVSWMEKQIKQGEKGKQELGWTGINVNMEQSQRSRWLSVMVSWWGLWWALVSNCWRLKIEKGRREEAMGKIEENRE